MATLNSFENKVGSVSSPFTAQSEMELMCSKNSHMSSMQEEKREFQLELQGLDNTQKGEY